jgi:hypothetical protein
MASLRQLHGLTGRLKATVEAGDWEALLQGLNDRQAVINRVDGLDPAELELTEDERTEAFTLVGEVVAADRELSSILEVSFENARSELQGFESTKASISAYRQTYRRHPGLVEARFVDKQR